MAENELRSNISLITEGVETVLDLSRKILNKYKEVEYIQCNSSGSGGFNYQYTASSNTKIITKMMIISTSSWNQFFSGYNGRGLLFDRHDTSRYRYYINDGSHRENFMSMSTNTVYTMEFTNSYYKRNNNKTNIGPYTFTANTDIFKIFGGGGQWRIYYFKIYDNDELLFDLVPAYNSDNKIGLLNKVDNTFLLGSGTYVVGPIIE